MTVFFNTYKHNFSDRALQYINIKIKHQELFDIWYIVYAFVLPMLKILHRFRKDNTFVQPILFHTYIEEIYELFKKNGK